MAKRFLLLLVLVAAVVSAADAKRSVTELPEVLVESPKRNMLHVMAYVREYSNLTTYSDTVILFREKMVDFMLPVKISCCLLKRSPAIRDGGYLGS